MLSNYCEKIRQKDKTGMGQINNVVLKKYVLHYKNLQLHLDLVLKLKKAHKVLQLNQPVWLKQYADFNKQERTAVKNTFERDFFQTEEQCIWQNDGKHSQKKETSNS